MTRWLWWALLAVLGCVTIFAQLDRGSEMRPALALMVPAPFRSYSQTPHVLMAMGGADRTAARAEAARLVRRRPMPAQHLYFLAMTDLRRADVAAFTSEFRVATTRGWRFAPLQVMAAQGALHNRDAYGAANRVAALWAADPQNPALPALTKALLDLPGGPKAFAQRLARARSWHHFFLTSAPSLAEPPVALRTILLAQDEGAVFDCEALGWFAQALHRLDPAIPEDAAACR